jgi:hypothetical protein
LFLAGISEQLAITINKNELVEPRGLLNYRHKRQTMVAAEDASALGVEAPVSNEDAAKAAVLDEAAASSAVVVQDSTENSDINMGNLAADEEGSGASDTIALPDISPQSTLADDDESSGAEDTVTLSPNNDEDNEEGETTTIVDEAVKAADEDELPTDGVDEATNEDFPPEGKNKALDKGDSGDETELEDEKIEGTTPTGDGPDPDEAEDDNESAAGTSTPETTTTEEPTTAHPKRVWFARQKSGDAESDASFAGFLNATCPHLDCEFGFRTDLEGKPTCSCYNPCNV